MRRYSHSGLACYEQCPYRYKLVYVDRVQVARKESIACFRGGAAHFGVECTYQEVMAGRLPTLDEVVDVTLKWWHEHFHKDLLVPDGRPEDYLAEALICVRNYYQAHYPFTEDETLAIEKRITADLNERYGIVGYIDRFARRDGQYEVHDFKTTTSPPRSDQPFSERQLAFYAMGVNAENPEITAMRLVWHYVFTGQVKMINYTIAQALPLREATLRLIARIEAEGEYRRHVGRLCRWCDYVEVCRPFAEHRTPTRGSAPA